MKPSPILSENDRDPFSRGVSRRHRSKIKTPKAERRIVIDMPQPHSPENRNLDSIGPESPFAWPDAGSTAVSPISTPGNETSTTHKMTPQTQASTPAAADEAIIPTPYCRLITSAFGYDCDLYTDVLDIPRDAHPRDIRVAYFRRGRQVLSDDRGVPAPVSDALHGGGSATINGAVSTTAKMKFQAVSMAFDILTNPEWREAYDMYGLHGPDDPFGTLGDDEFASMRSLASTSALRRSGSADRLTHSGKRTASRSKGGVRWKEEVEELVFAQDPIEVKAGGGFYDIEETDESDNSSVSASKKKKKKKKRSKKKIVLETEALKEHLEQLDKEAEQTFVNDFLDEIEQSIEGMLTFGSMGTSKGAEEQKEYFKDARKKLFHDDDAMPLFPVEEDLLFPDENREPDTYPESERAREEMRTKRTNKPKGRESTNPFDEEVASSEIPTDSFDANFPTEERPTTSPFNADEPMDENPTNPFSETEQAKTTNNPFDDEYEDFGHPHATGLQDPSPATPVKAKRPNKKKIEMVAPTELFVTKTTRRETDDDGASATLTVDDSVSTISASVVSVADKGTTGSSTSRGTRLASVKENSIDLNDTGDAVMHELDGSVNSADLDDDHVDTLNIVDELGCGNWCGEVQPSLSADATDDDVPFSEHGTSRLEQSDGDAPEFHVYLMSYLKALSHDLYEWGRSFGEMELSDTLALSEEDLESMMGILKTEMALTPGDLPKNHLPAELKQTLSF